MSKHINEAELKKLALQYHEQNGAGKISVNVKKPMNGSADLSLAYSPGVAYPVLEIAKNPDDAYKYTAKGNMIAVVSNGTAILGLGNLGPLASKPVMEGKAALFKKFANIDAVDIEIDAQDEDKIIQVVKAIAPSFGGINLEDIKAPQCFVVESKLREMLDIPVFHDDQHGTAIVASAGLINALKLTERKIEDVKIVCNGAGSAGIATLELFINLGADPKNIILCDTKGTVYKGRAEGMNQYKERYAVDTSARTLQEAMVGADVFYGVSAKGALKPEMVKSMAKNPIIFALANPDPEMLPDEVYAIRDDAIVATGRSDYPNQVNNVLCFPYIFRGALDVQAKAINMEMKKAACYALAELASNNPQRALAKDYIIVSPFDPRLRDAIPQAVAQAARISKVARL